MRRRDEVDPGLRLPVLDEDYDVQGTERRVYDDVISVGLADHGTVLAEPCSSKGGGRDAADDKG